jgi:hypothetical protein
MTSDSSRNDSPAPSSRTRRITIVVLAVAAIYALTTYILVPLVWSGYLGRHPGLKDVPGLTSTGDGHPGDPLNVALVGSERDVKRLLIAAHYYPADPLTLKSCLEIADATVLKRPYDEAPVSNLFLFGRKEDLSFEFPVGDNPRQRHHVRFWKSPHPQADGRPLWIGQTSFDESVGLSHTTGQITHHIAPDIDAERAFLFQHLEQSGLLQSQEAVAEFHTTTSGKNGGGDPWHTDGRLFLGVIRPE